MQNLTPNQFVGLISLLNTAYAVAIYIGITNEHSLLTLVAFVLLVGTWISIGLIFRYSETARRWRKDKWDRSRLD